MHSAALGGRLFTAAVLFCFFFVFFFLFFSLPFHQSTIIHSVLALKDKTKILIHFFAGAEVA